MTDQKKKWESQKEKLKLTFPKITDADLNFDERFKEVMLNKLQGVVGRTKKELQIIMETHSLAQ
jgi:hypothetical protein